MKTKVVINRCYGGFSLSKEAVAMLTEKLGGLDYYDIPRDHIALVETVGKLGIVRASGEFAKLEIVEVSETYWHIREYDGMETIMASNSPIKVY